jgi:hypothetical protein
VFKALLSAIGKKGVELTAKRKSETTVAVGEGSDQVRHRNVLLQPLCDLPTSSVTKHHLFTCVPLHDGRTWDHGPSATKIVGF